MKKIIKTEAEWKKILSDDEFLVTRKSSTEPAFSGKKFDDNKNGIFKCICCNANLFEGNKKFESGSVGLVFFKVILKNP